MEDLHILDCDLFDLADRTFDSYPESVCFEDFGAYRILTSIGKGGMGEVFLAEDQAAGRSVAIKFLRNVWAEPEGQRNFTREVQTLAKLEHPFIARLYELGIHPNGTPFFAMEYVDGKPLDQYCKERRCSLEEILPLFRAVCEAVRYAHSRAVIHLDLKPSNILITEDGTPKLLDFGIAKHLENLNEPVTQTQLRFTPAFAAPEQVNRQSVGTFTDVYALGIVLYGLLAGKPPYPPEGCAPDDREPPKPSASSNRISASKTAWRDLDQLCRKAMRKDVNERYHSVVELIQDIDHFLKGEPLMARPDALTYRTGKLLKRNQRAVIAASLSIMALIGIIVFFTLRLSNERNRALRQTEIATTMNQFLSDDLLGRSDPFKSGKAQESFADVVNRASARIDPQFKNEPAVAAGLHATIARAFNNRSEFARARPEYDRAIDLFQAIDGPLSQDAILLQLRWAVMEASSGERGSLKSAQSLVRGAQASISNIARPRKDVAVWLLYAQGVIAIVQNDARSANRNFSAALQQAEATGSGDEIIRTGVTQMVAFSYVRLAEGAKAEPLLRKVIAAYGGKYGENSGEVLRARLYLSQAFMTQKKYSDSIKEVTAIYPMLVSSFGQDHQITMAALGTRAASEGYFGMWDEAARDDLSLYNTAVRKQPMPSSMSVGSLSDAGLSQCRAHRFVEGESNARKAFQEAKDGFGPRAGITGGCAYALATCLIGRNELDEASDLLQSIDSDAFAQLSGDSSVAATIALAQGQISARRGDYGAAARYLKLAAPELESPNANSFDHKSFQELKRSIDSHLHP